LFEVLEKAQQSLPGPRRALHHANNHAHSPACRGQHRVHLRELHLCVPKLSATQTPWTGRNQQSSPFCIQCPR
jgi:hypothetical protein